jgi:hypothetical protein
LFSLAGVKKRLDYGFYGGEMRLKGKRYGGSLVGLILSIVLVLPSHAEDVGDHDRARQALEAGEILPLKTVLEKVGLDTPGQIMEVEMERKRERWVYEIKVLRPGGALVKLVIDASDGTILARGGRDLRPNH